MVVRPSSPSHVLSGRTLLSSGLGRYLVSLRWPLLLAAISGRALTLLSHSPCLSEHRLAWGLGGREVQVPTLNVWGHALEGLAAVCYVVELVVLMHVVHEKLLRLTLSSFDPWVIVLCRCRALASYSLSRAQLVGATALCPHDLGTAVTWVEFTLLLVLLEPAELQRADKTTVLLLNWLLSVMIVVPALVQQTPTNWDPDAKIDIWWLAPMTLRSQYVSALSSVIIYMGKAVMNFVWRSQSFMFLRAQFMLDVNRLDELFNRLDQDGDGRLSFADWQASLAELGIPADQLKAGFKFLDVGASGGISFGVFQRTLRKSCERRPNVSHSEHLTLLCRDAWAQAFHTVPLLQMVENVLAQWERVQLKTLSQDFYVRLLQNKRIDCLFAGKSMAGQAAMFSAFVAMALQWLAKQDFMQLEGDMLQLGARHAQYGVGVCMLSTFQTSLFGCLRSQLGGEFLEHEWALVWMHFVTRPFVRGLARARPGWASRRDLLRWAVDATLPVRSPGAGGAVPPPCAFGEAVSRLDAELRELWHPDMDFARTAVHSRTVAGVLEGVLRDLAGGEDARARSTLREAAGGAHWGPCGFNAAELARFQEAFLSAMRGTASGHCCPEKAMRSWAWILQIEIVDPLLMTPWAEIEDTLDAALQKVDPSAQLDAMGWLTITGALSVPQDLAKAALDKLLSIPNQQITFEVVRAALLSESMINPGRCCQQVMFHWCKALVK